MSFLEAKNLRKDHGILKRREGVWGAFNYLFQRECQTLMTVDGITFEIEKCEFVGYIEPNRKVHYHQDAWHPDLSFTWIFDGSPEGAKQQSPGRHRIQFRPSGPGCWHAQDSRR